MPTETITLERSSIELTPAVTEALEPLDDPPAVSERPSPPLDRRALWSLLGQHSSNTWSYAVVNLTLPRAVVRSCQPHSARAAEFAISITLVQIFPGTLLPASIYGFTTTACAIVFSRFMGQLVDAMPKLFIVRLAIAVQKASAAGFYACLLAMIRLQVIDGSPLADGLFALVVLCGCIHALSTICVGISMEREWATVISEGDSVRLTKVNAALRRIDLLCKLLSPLFVSLLTTAASYTFALAFLVAFDLAGMLFELYWTEAVYRRIPALAADQARKDEQHREQAAQRARLPPKPFHASDLLPRVRLFLRQLAQEWHTFAMMPIFLSSLAISALYLTVLSFDGVMIAYFKAHDFSDAFLAGMRGANVVAGLAGTLAMPLLEDRVGLVRAGSWSIWQQVASLVPLIAAFFAVVPAEGDTGPVWSNVLIFGGMISSRIGLWSFDLVQTKELQLSLAERSDRNTLTALQIAVQNMAQLAKYGLTIALSSPAQFRYVALVSFVSVCMGALFYTGYVRRERGHLVHLDRLGLTRLLSRKST